jgi:N-acetylglutamate synthase-like GNAT family acetyltransferase
MKRLAQVVGGGLLVALFLVWIYFRDSSAMAEYLPADEPLRLVAHLLAWGSLLAGVSLIASGRRKTKSRARNDAGTSRRTPSAKRGSGMIGQSAVHENGRVLMKQVVAGDIDELRDFLEEVNLTLSGLDAPSVRLWTERDADGSIVGSTGYELSPDGAHVLVRSVAVAPGRRAAGAGSRLAIFAMSDAARCGAGQAWLFSRRSGPFWQKLGFKSADRYEMAAVLAQTHQVRLFTETGQLHREVAWSRRLEGLSH